MLCEDQSLVGVIFPSSRSARLTLLRDFHTNMPYPVFFPIEAMYTAILTFISLLQHCR